MPSHTTRTCRAPSTTRAIFFTTRFLAIIALATVATSTQAQNIDLSIPSPNVPRIFGYEPGNLPNSVMWPAGDLNNDDYDDLLFSSSKHKVSGSNSPRGNIALGNPTFSSLDMNEFDTTNAHGFYSGTSSGSTGRYLNAAGDFNNDGYDDFIVGTDYQLTYLVYGSATFANLDMNTFITTNTHGFKITGPGTSATGIGDINNDGFDDIALSNFSFRYPTGNEQGRIFVIYGKSNATDIDLNTFISSPENGFKITGSNSSRVGMTIASAGDFNSDGIADMVFSCGMSFKREPNGTTYYTTHIFLKGKSGGYADIDYSENPGTLIPEHAFAILTQQLTGVFTETNSGSPMTNRDFNGDGFSDFIITNPGKSNNGGSFEGVAYVIFGQDDNTTNVLISELDTPTSKGFSIEGIAQESLGYSYAWAGDVNNDDRADLAINAHGANHNGLTRSGSTYVIYGKTSVTQTIDLATNFNFGPDGYRVDGPRANHPQSPSVSPAGDVNNDGYDDFLIGSYYYLPSPYAYNHEAYLIYGKSIPAAGIQNWINW